MGYEFEEPDDLNGGVRVYPKDVLNHLLLVWAVDYIEHSPTKYSRPDKKSDVIVVDLVDLDLDFEGDKLLSRRNWWRQGKLIASLRGKIGKPNPILAVMSMEPSSTGMNDAFVLVPMSGDEMAVARAKEWMSKHGDFEPSGQRSPANLHSQLREPGAQPRVQSAAPAAPRQPSLLERLASQQAAGIDRLPPAAPTDKPPF
jgi:hypothetical protein